MADSKVPTAPKHLSKEAQARWRRWVTERELDLDALETLELALEAFDRMRQAQAELLKAKSLFVRDHNGIARPHPAVIIERTSRAALLSAYKLLGANQEDA
jgi:phage terminase small subunit